MTRPIPSYPGKVYAIEDNLSVLRDPDNNWNSLRDRSGRVRTIPVRTEVEVTDVAADGRRNAYVRAIATDRSLPRSQSGWTRATNLAGKFLNELIGYVPVEWTLEPRGTNYTVTDGNALLRRDAPPFSVFRPHRVIPAGTEVVVTARSEATRPVGKYVQVSHGNFVNGRISRGEHIGFTAASNLTPGWSPFFTGAGWTNPKGDNACWRKGEFIGAKVLGDIVGTGGQMQRITLDLLEPYFKLMASAAESNIDISITSGFRTFAKQKRLRDLFEAGRGNLAARPGRSNHQHGQALDLLTHGFDHPVYRWMTANAPKLGFIRTVNKEHWHWEYVPKEAAALAERGLFRRANVRR